VLSMFCDNILEQTLAKSVDNTGAVCNIYNLTVKNATYFSARWIKNHSSKVRINRLTDFDEIRISELSPEDQSPC